MFHFRDLLRSRLLLNVIISLGFAGAVSGETPFEAFLEKHCIVCHGPQNEEGDLRLHQLSRDFKSGADTHHWAEVLDKVNSGVMPPEKTLQPAQEEIAAFVMSLDSRIREGHASQIAPPDWLVPRNGWNCQQKRSKHVW
jgi:hypothetical protein